MTDTVSVNGNVMVNDWPFSFHSDLSIEFGARTRKVTGLLFVATKSFSGISWSSVFARLDSGSSSLAESLGLVAGGAGGCIGGRMGGGTGGIIGMPGMNGGRTIGGTP
jgi:hypothetical protein